MTTPKDHKIRLPLWVDGTKSIGEYGGGPSAAGHRFTAYVIYDEAGNAIFDSLNADDCEIVQEWDEDGGRAWDENARRRADEIVLRVNTYDQRFIDGLVAMRAMLAAFVEHGGDPVVANSMRLNWNPSWGPDPDRPVSA